MLAFGVPSPLTRDGVAAIAALANLELAPTELDLFARQLAEILTYVEEIQAVDTSGVAPTAAVVTQHQSDRADVVAPSLAPDAALANAAESRPPYFRVPRVIG
jgi:aspartyl-tRNA(Asn)/glutamyl-tRNA(Gln) amidotransferase subunit C